MKQRRFVTDISNILKKMLIAVVMMGVGFCWSYDYKMKSDADTEWGSRTSGATDWQYYSPGFIGIGKGWHDASDDPGKNNNNNSDTVTLQYQKNITVTADVKISSIKVTADPTLTINNDNTLSPQSIEVTSGNNLTINTSSTGKIALSTIKADSTSTIKITGSGTIDVTNLDSTNFSGKIDISEYTGNKTDLQTALENAGIPTANILAATPTSVIIKWKTAPASNDFTDISNWEYEDGTTISDTSSWQSGTKFIIQPTTNGNDPVFDDNSSYKAPIQVKEIEILSGAKLSISGTDSTKYILVINDTLTCNGELKCESDSCLKFEKNGIIFCKGNGTIDCNNVEITANATLNLQSSIKVQNLTADSTSSIVFAGSEDQVFESSSNMTFTNFAIKKSGGSLKFTGATFTIPGTDIDSEASDYTLDFDSPVVFNQTPNISKANLVKFTTNCTSVTRSSGGTIRIHTNLENNATLTMASDLVIIGDFEDKGSITGNTITLGGTGTFTPSSIAYKKILVDNAANSGTITLNGDLTTTNFEIKDGGSFAAGANTINISSSWNTNTSGNFTKGTSTVNFTDANPTISGVTDFSTVEFKKSATIGTACSFENLKTDDTITTPQTLTINSDITVTNDLLLKGANLTNTWTITGSGSIKIPSNTTGGDYLVVDPTVTIKSTTTPTETKYYTAENSFPFSYPTKTVEDALNSGWIIQELKLFTFVWNGSQSADWNEKLNWSPNYVPVEDATIQINNTPAPANYPELSTTNGNGGNITIASGATLTLNDDKNLVLTGNAGNSVATTTLTNNGIIIFKSSGRIKKGTGLINDNEHGTVEYNGNTTVTAYETDSFEYNNLVLNNTNVKIAGTINAAKIEIKKDCSVTADTILKTDDLTISAKVEDSTKNYNVTLHPSTLTKKIYVGAVETGQYSIPNSEIEKITVKNLIIGTNLCTGGIEIKDSLTAQSGLYLTTAGALTQRQSGAAINTIAGELHLEAAGGIGTISATPASDNPIVIGSVSGIVSAINSTNGDIHLKINSNDKTTLGGAESTIQVIKNTNSGGHIKITTNGPIEISGDITTTGTGNLYLNANGSIAKNAGTLTAEKVDLSATTGIGTSSSLIETKANYISAISSTNGGIFIQNNGATTFNSISTQNADVMLRTTGFTFTPVSPATKVVTAGTGTVTFNSYATNGAITLTTDIFDKIECANLNIGKSTHTGDITLETGALTLPAQTTFTGNRLTINSAIAANNKDITIRTSEVDISSGSYTYSGTEKIVFSKDGTGTTLTTAASTTLNNIEINSGTTLTTASTFNVKGNWTNNGTFTGTGSTIHFAGTGTTANPQIIAGSSETTFNNLEIDSGTVVQAGTNISLTGNWTNNDEFDANGKTVTFKDNTTITGNTIFYNLVHTTANKNIELAPGTKITVTGKLTLTGQNSQLISLDSTDGTSSWEIKCEGTGANAPSISYVDVKNATNTSSYRLTAENSKDSGNNIYWDFPGQTYTWIGQGGAGGTGDSDWFNKANWNPASVPGLGTKVIIAEVTSPGIYPELNHNLDTTNDSTSSSLGVNGELTINSNAEINFATFGLTANTITNNGRVILAGSQTITATTITNDSASTVEYTGDCSNIPMKSSYGNLEFTSGATGTIFTPITVAGYITITSAGNLSITSAEDVKIADAASCDSLTITADSKSMELKGSVTATDTVSLTAATVKTTNTTGASLSADSGFTINGKLENSGKTTFAKAAAITGDLDNTNELTFAESSSLDGSLSNTGILTISINLSVTKNISDTGNLTGVLKLTGTSAQEFTPNAATSYNLVVNKNSGNVEFKDTVKLDSINTNTSAVDSVLIFDNGMILNNNSEFTIPVEVASNNSTTAKITATGKDITFKTLKLNSSTEITASNTSLNGDITLPDNSTNYLKVNGNLDSNSASVKIAPSVMLNGDFSGTNKATFQKNLYIVGASSLQNLGVTGDLVFDSTSDYTTAGTITANNIVLYRGTIKATGTLKAKNDVILLGSNSLQNDIEKRKFSKIVYARAKVSGDFNSTEEFTGKMPDKTELTKTGSFTGEYKGGADSVLYAGKHFYANGLNLKGTSEWFVVIPDITNATNGFAEAYNCTVEYSTVRYFVNEEGSEVVKDNNASNPKVQLPAYNCTGADDGVNEYHNKFWLFKDFYITDAYTVRDNVIYLEFNHPIRNFNGEITGADGTMSLIKNSAENSFTKIYKDPDCQTEYGNTEDITTYVERNGETFYYFYLLSPDSWNTDATGTNAGTSKSTDRSGTHKTIVPTINYFNNAVDVLTDIWGKRLTSDADGNGGSSSIRTNVLDNTGPVLYKVLLGQEQHTPYDRTIGAASQPDYDSHNFIEFRYSEPVNFGDPSSPTNWNPAPAPGSPAPTDAQGFFITQQVDDSLGAITGDITASSNVTLAGLGTFISAKFQTGSNGSNNKYVNILYRIDPYTIRLAIAGYTEGTTTDRDGNVYKNWKGYIESAKQPSGKVSMPSSINSMVTDCATNSNGQTNPQEQYAEGHRIEPSVDASSNGIYGPWDLSAPVFAPLRLKASEEWSKSAPGEAEYYEAVGNTSGAGSTLHKIEFHFFDNTPDYTTSEFAWLTEKGWVKNVLDSKELYRDYTYCADIFGGSRDFHEDPSKRTTGGLRFSSISHANTAFKYIATQAGNPIPDIPFSQDADAIFPGAKAPLFTGSSATRRAADDPDGLYFGIKLPDTSMSLDRSFTISYDEQQGYITDLAGNRLRSATIKTIDRTPPAYDFLLSPLHQDELHIVFVKELAVDTDELNYNDSTGTKMTINETFESLIPKCFKLFKMDSEGNTIESDDLNIDYSTPAIIEKIESEANHQIFTTIRLRLTRKVTLKDIEETYIRIKIPEGYATSQDPVTGLNDSKVTFIQDRIGNFMQTNTAHSLSDFAISSLNPLYAYDQDMEYNGSMIMDGLYEEGSWAVHDWNANQQNFGTLPANHPYGIVADIVSGSEGQQTKSTSVRLFLSANPSPKAVSEQINSDLNINLRIWLPEVEHGDFQFMALENVSQENYASVDSELLNKSDSNRILFNISREISQNFGGDKQISFLFGFTDSNNELVRIYNSPYYDVANDKYNLRLSTAVPLYALRLTNPEDITSIDLWSFKTKSITEQRGGVTILNNVINATKGEKVALKVNMPSDGKLNVSIMTLDGNVITYLNHGSTSAGEHYYSWNGRNKAGNLVARGMYFIRVVGNGIDETRKVMVVK